MPPTDQQIQAAIQALREDADTWAAGSGKLVDAAIETGAQAILISTIISHNDTHRMQMRKLAEIPDITRSHCGLARNSGS